MHTAYAFPRMLEDLRFLLASSASLHPFARLYRELQPRRMDEAWRALLFLEKIYPNEVTGLLR